MTQADALAQVGNLVDQNYMDQCTGDVTTCPHDECVVCAVRDCPGKEPLHYHHDGCPYGCGKEV